MTRRDSDYGFSEDTVVDNIYIFEVSFLLWLFYFHLQGKSNPFVLSRVYDVDWICEYDMRWWANPCKNMSSFLEVSLRHPILHHGHPVRGKLRGICRAGSTETGVPGPERPHTVFHKVMLCQGQFFNQSRVNHGNVTTRKTNMSLGKTGNVEVEVVLGRQAFFKKKYKNN